jgi:uncharacterized membrane protein
MPIMNKILKSTFWLISIAMVLFSCNITKAKKTTAQDSTQVIKTDTGAVKKNTSTEKNASEWERQIVIYPRDTTINHYYTQPAKIIYERGSQTQEKQAFNYDSAWQKKIDSMQVSTKETVKEKKEQALNFWQIIALVIGAILLMKLIPNFKLTIK